MSNLVLEMINYITSYKGRYFQTLKENVDFIRLLIRAFYGKERELVDMDPQILKILNNIYSLDKDLKEFLIKTGLIMFILNIIFDNSEKNKKK